MTRLFCIDAAGGWVRVFVCILLAVCSISSAIVRHDDTLFSGHPLDAVVGRWSTNASCVAIDPNFIITTRHQGGSAGTTVVFDGVSYKAAQIINIDNNDLRIVRITTPDGQSANLSSVAAMNTVSTDTGKLFAMSGFGKGRGDTLYSGGVPYGYKWLGLDNTIQRWGQNTTESAIIAQVPNSYVSEALVADFDQTGTYEACLAEWDSGGGWFIDVKTKPTKPADWRLVAMSAYTAHQASPPITTAESWFDNPALANANPDILYGIRIKTYASTLNAILAWMETAPFISGYVSDETGQPFENMYINANDIAGQTITDSAGYYEIYVPVGWTGTLSTSKTGYSFSSLPFTNLQSDANSQNFTAIINQNVSDNFNDNAKNANWLDISQDYANINVMEVNEVLNFTSTGDACDVKAYYKSNEWSIDTTANFSLKIDFNDLLADTNDNFAYLKIIRDANNYAYIGIGSNSIGRYYEMKVIENSDVNAFSHIATSLSAGKFYVYYNRSTDSLYLSLADYGGSGIVAKTVLADSGSWASGSVKIEIGAISNNCRIVPGEITFDNFVVNTGNISGWRPRTDVNKDGFITIDDFAEISSHWLTDDPNADIDESGIVDFADIERFCEVM